MQSADVNIALPPKDNQNPNHSCEDASSRGGQNRENSFFQKGEPNVWARDLHSWEQLMLLSLGVTGLAALAVFITTASVVILQRNETAQTKREYEAYKLTVEGQVAEARKRGLKLERLPAMRF